VPFPVILEKLFQHVLWMGKINQNFFQFLKINNK